MVRTLEFYSIIVSIMYITFITLEILLVTLFV